MADTAREPTERPKIWNSLEIIKIAATVTTPIEAARRLEITQPRLNDLVRGRIAKFSLDMLVNLATRANIHVRLRINKAA